LSRHGFEPRPEWRCYQYHTIFFEKNVQLENLTKGDEYMLEEKVVTSPVCSSQKAYKDGIRYSSSKENSTLPMPKLRYMFSQAEKDSTTSLGIGVEVRFTTQFRVQRSHLNEYYL
jgi:hypothetical protein